MPTVADQRAGRAGEQIADEGRGREHGPGVTWPTAIASSSCASVSQCEALDEVRLQEREQDVAAAEQHRADLEEDAEQRQRARPAPPAAGPSRSAPRARRARSTTSARRPRATRAARSARDAPAPTAATRARRRRAHASSATAIAERRAAATTRSARGASPTSACSDDGDDHRLDAVRAASRPRARAEADVGPARARR